MKRVRDYTRDTQRSRVYAADHEINALAGGHGLDLDQCHKIVEGALARYGISGGIEIRPGSRRRSACADETGRVLKLPRWSRSPVIVLHEAAHAIISRARWSRPARGFASHGPEYAAVQLDLLRAFSLVDRKLLTAAYRKHKIKVARGATARPKPLTSGAVKRLAEIAKEVHAIEQQMADARMRLGTLDNERTRLRVAVAR